LPGEFVSDELTPETDQVEVEVVETQDVEPKKQRKFFHLPKTKVGKFFFYGVGVPIFLVGAASAISIAMMLTKPSTDPVSARVANWMRDHGIGFVVTGVEWVEYQLNPPTIGGDPDQDIIDGQVDNSPTPSESSTEPVTLRQPMPTQVTPALKGEGIFKTKVEVDGVPVIQVAYVRPDKEHTSYLAGVVWMSGKHVSFEQHPGTDDPGQLERWSTGIQAPKNEASGMIATFNGGFKVADSQGGYYQDNITLGKLQNGSASIVVYKDGTQDIGMWGRDFKMSPDVKSVRQNLKLLVDNGKLSTNVDSAVSSSWGATLGGGLYVWRSGIGVTADGDFVYVVGDALSARTLAEILVKAGCVRAMQLDINRWWVSYMWYLPNERGHLNPYKPVEFPRPANRYQVEASRDFFVVYFKP
jgi:hypothetical protein